MEQLRSYGRDRRRYATQQQANRSCDHGGLDGCLVTRLASMFKGNR
jgi:hypothetical protein